jgi:OFA family oxalate/formate antiporter-like MFS transporter
MIPTNWPFKPDRLPFFYGWVVLICSALGIIFSLPGQTIGLAVFTDSLIEVLGLSRTELSMAYLLGTIVSSLFLARAGRWYDIWGGRIMIPAASVGLSLMIFFCQFCRSYQRVN